MAVTVTLTLQRAFRAWDYARVDGFVWASAPISAISLVDATGEQVPGGTARLDRPAPGEAAIPFHLSCLSGEALVLMDCALAVDVRADDGPVVLALAEHVGHLTGGFPGFDAFRSLVDAHPSPRVLEVGGRARSGVLHRDLLPPVSEYVALDIVPGPGVDVVGDAHVMADLLGEARFDFACSYVVWEHLAMPWKVVVELNRVLVDGAHAYIVAPQTCGMHDLPWDFFRFSDSAFRALFAAETGFEVVDVVRGTPMHVFPFAGTGPLTHGNEHTAGFFAVAVLVRKVGPTSLRWEADATRVVDEPYPA